MSKCDKCNHKGICKHEESMQKFEKDINEKSKPIEYKNFSVEIQCNNFFIPQFIKR